jgi:ribosomal protein S18 acetylase RimI-like enzyme
MFDMRITDQTDEAGAAELRSAVVAFNQAATGCVDGKALSCLLRDEEGRLVAGLDGFTWGGYGMIEWLWVREDHRRSGLGERLVSSAEEEAVARGCGVMRVNTHSFQAPHFYERLGYEQVGVADDTPRGHQEFFFAKRLTAST